MFSTATSSLPHFSLIDTHDLNYQQTNLTSNSHDCLLLHLQEFIPWDNPANIVDFEVEDSIRKVKESILHPLLFLIAFPANIINMLVFYKQGLRERINVCLFALSLSDELLMLFNLIFFGEQLVLRFTTAEIYGPFVRFMSNNNLVGFFGIIWVSQIMSAIIATDRCFCVMQPLRAQTVIHTSTMTAIIISVFFVVPVLFFLVATRYRIKCAYDASSDTIMMLVLPGEFYFRHQQLVDYLDSFVFGGALPGLVFLVVTTTTTITAIKLRQAAAWRGSSSSSSGLSAAEIALTKMLVANSIFFIACVFPFGVVRLVIFFFPEVNSGGRLHNFYMLVVWFLHISSYINSTFNIVVYYVMGSRFRQTFWQLFRRKKTG